jgi:hypothetical protein
VQKHCSIRIRLVRVSLKSFFEQRDFRSGRSGTRYWGAVGNRDCGHRLLRYSGRFRDKNKTSRLGVDSTHSRIWDNTLVT